MRKYSVLFMGGWGEILRKTFGLPKLKIRNKSFTCFFNFLRRCFDYTSLVMYH